MIISQIIFQEVEGGGGGGCGEVNLVKSHLIMFACVCVCCSQHPYIGEHFSKLMSPLLLLIDDYEVCCILDVQLLNYNCYALFVSFLYYYR